MTVTVFRVILYCADGSVDKMLFEDESRRRCERAAKHWAEGLQSEIAAGQSIGVEECKVRTNPGDWYDQCEDGMVDYDARDRRAYDEERISMRAHRPSEY